MLLTLPRGRAARVRAECNEAARADLPCVVASYEFSVKSLQQVNHDLNILNCMKFKFEFKLIKTYYHFIH